MLEKVYGDYWKTVIDTMLEGLMLVETAEEISRENISTGSMGIRCRISRGDR